MVGGNWVRHLYLLGDKDLAANGPHIESNIEAMMMTMFTRHFKLQINVARKNITLS